MRRHIFLRAVAALWVLTAAASPCVAQTAPMTARLAEAPLPLLPNAKPAADMQAAEKKHSVKHTELPALPAPAEVREVASVPPADRPADTLAAPAQVAGLPPPTDTSPLPLLPNGAPAADSVPAPQSAPAKARQPEQAAPAPVATEKAPAEKAPAASVPVKIADLPKPKATETQARPAGRLPVVKPMAQIPLQPAPRENSRVAPAQAPAPGAAPSGGAGVPPGQTAPRPLALEVNKSRVMRLARPARDVLVANPAIADIVLRSADMAYVVGRRVGETNVFFFDGAGQQIDALDVTVGFDSTAVAGALRQMIPTEQISVTTANQSLVLTGVVASPQVAENARQIARQYVADDKSIINLLSIRDKSQVLLRVRVSEMSRQVVKELGITPGSPPFNFRIGGSTFKFSGNTPNFTSTPFAALNAVVPLGGANTLTALLQALESNGLVKTLAEPNLTAVSGETASFLVGGQFPVPSPQPSAVPGAASTIAVVYKDFGVRLTFTPVVMSAGLISLRIATEVSQLSTQGQINANGFLIPALTVRRAETTVELPSGGSIAIAGLLQNDIQSTLQGFPILKDIPILGSLFSSTDFQRRESDLVIAVTPLLVRPVDPNLLAFPTDGFGPASDFNMYVLHKLHATYTKPEPAAVPPGHPNGPYGYILE